MTIQYLFKRKDSIRINYPQKSLKNISPFIFRGVLQTRNGSWKQENAQSWRQQKAPQDVSFNK